MKVGDEILVNMGGFDVANAVIEDISDGKATIYIPATRVVMGVKSTLTDLAPEVDRDVALEEVGGKVESDAIDEQVRANDTKIVQNDDVGDGLSQVKLDSSALD